MPAFNVQKRTLEPLALDVVTVLLGADAIESAKVTTKADVGKAAKLDAYPNIYILPTGGDEIEGFIDSVSSGSTYNDGFIAGGVAQRGDHWAEIGANQGVTAAKVGDLVVADTQDALGTVGKAKVKTGVPSAFVWRITRIDGDGTAGSRALVTRV